MYIGNQPLSQAFVTDQFSGNGSTTAFTMSVAPANTASVLVAISGVLQDPSTYSVSGTTLTFSAAPPTATGNISARYLGIPASGVTTTAYRTITEFTATAAQTTFTPASYTVGFIQVFRNGVLLGSADYTASNGTTVVLAVGATAGDLVTTESFYVSSVLNAIPATAGAVNSTYIAAGAVGTTQIANNAITTAQIAAGAVAQVDIATGVAGTGPAFSAYQSSAQTGIASNAWTKIQFQTEEYDTASCFDNATNYRFTPTVAGYYQVNTTVQVVNNTGPLKISIYKNGSSFKQGGFSTTTSFYAVSVSGLVYCNGTSDYLEVYVYSGGTVNTGVAGADTTFFQASMVRSA
jgi:hypothetical protein